MNVVDKDGTTKVYIPVHPWFTTKLSITFSCSLKVQTDFLEILHVLAGKSTMTILNPATESCYSLSLVSIWTFFAFRCSFWFFVPTKSHNEQCDAQMETSTKNQNEQQKAITSNKRHLPVLVFEIELILSQKQERATKSSKRQRTANGNTHQKPKRATKSNKEHFSFPFSFIRTSSGPVEGGLYQEQ